MGGDRLVYNLQAYTAENSLLTSWDKHRFLLVDSEPSLELNGKHDSTNHYGDDEGKAGHEQRKVEKLDCLYFLDTALLTGRFPLVQ